MELLVKRKSESDEWTIGELYIDGKFECYTLEDQHQDKKVMHETRIGAGRHEIKLRTEGTHHEKYTKRFPGFHKGMLWLQDVENFQWILIHIGNTDSDTSGCILVGQSYVDGILYGSTAAYAILYKKVIKAFDKGERVFITILDPHP
jgi:hypothetical protein